MPSYIESLPTLYSGWTADLKFETSYIRVWLSRLGIEDGELHENTVYFDRRIREAGSWNKEDYNLNGDEITKINIDDSFVEIFLTDNRVVHIHDWGEIWRSYND